MTQQSAFVHALHTDPWAFPFAVLFVLLLFDLSMLAHELGHAWAIRKLLGDDALLEVKAGIGVFYRRGRLSLGILPIWGYARFTESMASPMQWRIIFLAGPVASVFMGGVFSTLAMLPIPDNWVQAFIIMGIANYALAAVNLIPIPPLDGWKIVESYLPAFGIQLKPAQRALLYRWGMVFIIVVSALFLLENGVYHG